MLQTGGSLPLRELETPACLRGHGLVGNPVILSEEGTGGTCPTRRTQVSHHSAHSVGVLALQRGTHVAPCMARPGARGCPTAPPHPLPRRWPLDYLRFHGGGGGLITLEGLSC